MISRSDIYMEVLMYKDILKKLGLKELLAGTSVTSLLENDSSVIANSTISSVTAKCDSIRPIKNNDQLKAGYHS